MSDIEGSVIITMQSGDYPKDGTPTLRAYDRDQVTIFGASDIPDWSSVKIEAVFVHDGERTGVLIDPETGLSMTPERAAELGIILNAGDDDDALD